MALTARVVKQTIIDARFRAVLSQLAALCHWLHLSAASDCLPVAILTEWHLLPFAVFVCLPFAAPCGLCLFALCCTWLPFAAFICVTFAALCHLH